MSEHEIDGRRIDAALRALRPDPRAFAGAVAARVAERGGGSGEASARKAAAVVPAGLLAALQGPKPGASAAQSFAWGVALPWVVLVVAVVSVATERRLLPREGSPRRRCWRAGFEACAALALCAAAWHDGTWRVLASFPLALVFAGTWFAVRVHGGTCESIAASLAGTGLHLGGLLVIFGPDGTLAVRAPAALVLVLGTGVLLWWAPARPGRRWWAVCAFGATFVSVFIGLAAWTAGRPLPVAPEWHGRWQASFDEPVDELFLWQALGTSALVVPPAPSALERAATRLDVAAARGERLHPTVALAAQRAGLRAAAPGDDWYVRALEDTLDRGRTPVLARFAEDDVLAVFAIVARGDFDEHRRAALLRAMDTAWPEPGSLYALEKLVRAVAIADALGGDDVLERRRADVHRALAAAWTGRGRRAGFQSNWASGDADRRILRSTSESLSALLLMARFGVPAAVDDLRGLDRYLRDESRVSDAVGVRELEAAQARLVLARSIGLPPPGAWELIGGVLPTALALLLVASAIAAVRAAPSAPSPKRGATPRRDPPSAPEAARP